MILELMSACNLEIEAERFEEDVTYLDMIGTVDTVCQLESKLSNEVHFVMVCPHFQEHRKVSG